MSKFCDPIAYCFTFRTVTSQAVEPSLKEIFRKLVLPLKEYVLRYGGFEKDLPGQGLLFTYNKFVKSEEDVPLANQFVPTQYHTLAQTSEIYDSLLEQFTKFRYQALCIQGNDKAILKHYTEKPTPLAKEYQEWLTKSKDTPDFENNRKHIFRLFSCPSDDLLDVLMPLSIIRHIFRVDYRSWPLSSDGIPAVLLTKEEVIVTNADNEKGLPHYLHEINIAIPRFLIGKSTDTLEMQQSWTEALIQLGSLYPVSTGTIYMDIPNALHDNITCYDREALVSQKRRYITERIPGYAWAMLVNEDQAKRLTQNEAFDRAFFHRKQYLDNGSIFFQMTPDMRIMSMQDCNNLRCYFASGLPDVNIRYELDSLPPSLRLGFAEEEMVFEKLHDSSLFEVELPSKSICYKKVY